MDNSQKEYAAFEEKVKRSVYLDNLSPQVTESVVKTALNQFGNVIGVQFIPNYTISMNIPKCALVEMETPKQASAVVAELANFPFMMCGMPRPVRARSAEPEMFDNRPAKPGKKIMCRWLDPKEPDFEVATKLKQLTQKHAAEASFLLKKQLREEENLAKQQAATLEGNYRKFEMIDNALADGKTGHLVHSYGMNNLDEK